MKSVSLTRSDASTTTPGVYRMDLTISSSNDITTKLFVKERITNADASINDVFVTVANTVDIEDYAEDAPAVGDKYFRSNAISLVNSDPQVLSEIFDEVLMLLQVVCQQATDLETLAVSAVYTITKDGSSVDNP